MINKKILITLVLITIISLASISLLLGIQIINLSSKIVSLENQQNEYENQISEYEKQLLLGNVNITSLTIKYPGVVVWGTVAWNFDVTIQNTGSIDMVGATLIVKMPSDIDSYHWNSIKELEIVHGGEESMISMEATSDMDGWYAYMNGPSSYVVTLLIDENVLDEIVYTND